MQVYTDYFNARNVKPDFYSNYRIPGYLNEILPKNKDSKILDIGCGFGMTLNALRERGYKNLKGIDLSDEAIEYCKSIGLDVEKIEIIEYCNVGEKYDLIIMSHVLEHIDKAEVINTLSNIRKFLLSPDGYLCIMVPNAQSNTGAYWAFEDFTHHTIFTSGSIIFVLKMAGYNYIKFLDPEGMVDSRFLIKLIKKFLLKIYRANNFFWNKITSSSYHKESPSIFTYDLKVLAK